MEHVANKSLSSNIEAENNEKEESGIVVSEPEILEAFYEFIAKFTKIEKDLIFQIYQPDNQASARLRKNKEFAVINLLESKSRGANIQRIEFVNSEQENNITNSYDKEVQYSLQEARIEIEITAPLQFEVLRSIQLLLQMFTHPRGLEHFFSYSIVPLYAHKALEESKFEKEKLSYSAKIECCFTYYSKLEILIDTFSSVNFITKHTDIINN